MLLVPSSVVWHNGEEKNQKVVVVEPCYFGYGTTLGNALRRVLLSSLPGSAVQSVVIKGVNHEFSALSGVAEDIVDIILNLKKLNIKVYSDSPVKLTLKAKGEKTVTAADIEKNSDVEIVNPDHVIATLTDKKTELEMQITVARGRGYVPTEQRDKSTLEVGEIAIDAAYGPVFSAGFKVENTRVGQITDFDKLSMTIETDGTVTPEEAFGQAVDIILEQFNVLKNGGSDQSSVAVAEPVVETAAE